MTTTKPQSTTEPKSDDDPHRWEVEPHPWSTDFDYLITDSDVDARTAILHAAEMYLWDGNEGGERVLKVRLNADIPEASSSISLPASAAPVVDNEALKKRARQIIDAVIQSPVIVEVRTFSQPEEVDKLEGKIVALLQKPTPAAATAAPVEQEVYVSEDLKASKQPTNLTGGTNQCLTKT